MTEWLGRLGRGGLINEFSQKTLRQWKRANVPHRSFTVVRHPVARAHAVFCAQIMSGAMPEIRQTLIKTYQD